jgi:capsular polysaccharide transport system permease protein
MTLSDFVGGAAAGSIGARYGHRLAPIYALLRRPLFLYLVAIPNFIAILYFGLMASPVFVSHTSLMVMNPAVNASSMTSMLSGGSGDGSSQGAFLLQDFIGSWQEFRQLNQQFDLARNFRQGDRASAYGGLSTGLRDNDIALWNYYRKHASVEVDVKSGIASLAVESYRPEFSQKIASAILKDCVARLNAMAQQQQQDLVSNSEKRKAILERTLQRDNVALAAYRGQVGTYDPKEQYVSNLSLLNSLAERKAELQSQLDTVRAATPNSPDVKNMTAALASLQRRIASASLQAGAVGRQSAGYDALVSHRDNDLSLLQQANVAAQDAGQKIAQSRYYLNVISNPSMPQTPELPNRLYWIVGVIAVTLILWGLLR